MSRYVIKAINDSGEFISEALEYGDNISLFQYLKKRGLHPIEITDVSSSLYKNINIRKVTLDDLSLFCSELAVLLGSGESVKECLSILAMQNENERFKNLINRTYYEVLKGKSLSEAMKACREFPDILANIVEAGEASGRLDEVMSVMASFFEKEKKLKQNISSALAYPLFAALSAIIVLIFFILKILPIFNNIFQRNEMKLPFFTRALSFLVYGVIDYWYYLIMSVILFIYLMKIYIRTDRGKRKISSILIYMPFIGNIYKKFTALMFSNTLYILLKNGVQIIDSLNILKSTFKNILIFNAIKNIADDLNRGESLSSLNKYSDLFPPMLIYMMKIGEQTGTLDDMLLKASEYLSYELEREIKRFSDLISPVMTILLGVFICILIISIIMPLFDMFKIVL